jgi:hypothetical protein
MQPVWLVRSRELTSRMKFWTSLVGYNSRDRSLSQAIYLIYVAIFFCLWGFAVLALLANLGAGMLSLIKGASPSMASIMIIVVVLLADTIIRGYRSGKTSPFIFSDVDAELICQTPVDRRQVALAWFLGDWLIAGLTYGALAVILRFASLQLVEQGGIVWAHFPRYLLAGMQIMSIILPLHMAFMALDYALGALRLQRDVDNSWLHWFPVGVAVVLITLALVSLQSLQIILWPLLFTLQAGFGEANWLIGFIVVTILAIIGLLILYWVSLRLNLSRAAQESRFQWAVQQVSWLGDSRLGQQMKARRRLGAGHSASQVKGISGYPALIWKEWVTTFRGMKFSSLIGWFSLFGVALVMVIVPDGGARLWAFIIWVLLVGQRCTESLRGDLEVWIITRQLPFSGRELLMVEVAAPMVVATLLSWSAIGVSSWLGFSPHLSFILLAPAIIICIILAAEVDILRQCRSSDLVAGQVAELGAGGLVLGFILAGIPLITVLSITSRFTGLGIIWLVTIFSLALSLGIIFVMWRFAVATYQSIK